MTTKRKTPEKTLVRNEFVKMYKAYSFSGDILWWQILAAEDDKHCPAGTLDSVVCVNQGNGSICLWFNEFKAPGKAFIKRRETGIVEPNYRYEQKMFVESMDGKPKIYCSITDNVNQFSMHLKRAKAV